MVNMLPVKAVDRLENAVGSKKLGEIFLELGYLTREKLELALEYQAKRGGKLGRILAALDYISRLQLYEGLAKHFSLPFETDTENIRRKLDINLAIELTREEMVRYQVVPLQTKGKTLTVITSEPYDPPAMDFLKEKFGTKKINQMVVTDLDIMNLSEELYLENILDMSYSGLDRNFEKSARRASARTYRKKTAYRIKQASRILPVPEDASELVVIKRGKRKKTFLRPVNL